MFPFPISVQVSMREGFAFCAVELLIIKAAQMSKDSWCMDGSVDHGYDICSSTAGLPHAMLQARPFARVSAILRDPSTA